MSIIDLTSSIQILRLECVHRTRECADSQIHFIATVNGQFRAVTVSESSVCVSPGLYMTHGPQLTLLI